MPCPGIYQTVGGTPTCRRLAEALYARIGGDPRLRPLFPGKTFTCAIEAFTAYLVQFLGGPPEDAQSRWWLSLRESHQRFPIGQSDRDARLSHMTAALDEVPLEAPMRAALQDFFQRGSAYLVNQGALPASPGNPSDPQLADRWQHQLALDNIVSLIRAGDAAGAIQAAAELDLPPSVHCGLLAVMVGHRQAALLDHVHDMLRRRPDLVQARYNGRTLLHAAAAAGHRRTVELLLLNGADPAATDGGGHTPLYALANECALPEGAGIIPPLLAAGADLNVCGGVKRCTPLHMAARRGTVPIAAALLDHGANIEARDSLGETPLRRAVNCNRQGVAALLVSRGADVGSKSTKGLTPLDAARTDAMRRVLRTS